MKRFFPLLILFFHVVPAQTVDTLRIAADSVGTLADSVSLAVVIPETDTVRTSLARHRFAARTIPSAKAFAQGREVRVYPTGAFVGLVDLPADTSTLRLSVLGLKGDSLWRDFVFIRAKPLQTSPLDPLTIDRELMEPSEDLWLRAGEVVDVKFKGSPGCEASFSIDGVESDIPMRELPSGETGGLEGVYVGQYTVKEDDNADGVRIEVSLQNGFWSSEDAMTRGKVSFGTSLLPLVAEVTGRRPFLNVGLGADRLGGAKLGYIDPGVRIAVIGKVGRQYRVRLSAGMTGWIPAEYVRLLPTGTPEPSSLTGSITVMGTKSEDVIVVGMNQKLPYVSEQLTTPPTILVDIFGATSNTNWITHHLSAEGVESVSWDQVAEGQYQLRIILKHQAHWGYDIGYGSGTSLRIRVQRPPVLTVLDSSLKNLVIAVDAGHGGENFGALGATGVREMDVTLSIARHLERVLQERGASVVLTRSDSTGPSMIERAEAVIASKGHLLVSIHCNSIGYGSDPERIQ
ncbi:MAG TPA: N-acetylmuramoyl-L-alanine amidase, partial [Bacteroidota bacterium]